MSSMCGLRPRFSWMTRTVGRPRVGVAGAAGRRRARRPHEVAAAGAVALRRRELDRGRRDARVGLRDLLGGGEVRAQRFEQRRGGDAAGGEPRRAVEEAAPIDARRGRSGRRGAGPRDGSRRRSPSGLRGLLRPLQRGLGSLVGHRRRAIGSAAVVAQSRNRAAACASVPRACESPCPTCSRPARGDSPRSSCSTSPRASRSASRRPRSRRRCDARRPRAGGDRRLRRLALPAVGVQVGGRPVRRHLLVGALRPAPDLDLPDAARHDGDAAGRDGRRLRRPARPVHGDHLPAQRVRRDAGRRHRRARRQRPARRRARLGERLHVRRRLDRPDDRRLGRPLPDRA